MSTFSDYSFAKKILRMVKKTDIHTHNFQSAVPAKMEKQEKHGAVTAFEDNPNNALCYCDDL